MAMTAAPMAGQYMKVMWDIATTPTFVDGVQSVTFARKGGTAETTAALSTQNVKDKTYLGTLRDASGSVKLRYVNLGDPAQIDLFNSVADTAPATLGIYLDAATKVLMEVIITAFNVDDAIDGIAAGSIDFQVSGDVVASAV